MYNDLGGCDEDFITRNIHIAVGYGLYNSGALRIACGVENQLTRHGIEWIVLTSAMIFTTEHICDLKDQAGDKARGRSSAPIVLGDGICRWTIALPVIFWSILCPAFFGLGFWGYAIPVVVGTVVAVRTVIFRTVEDDSLTWKIWALWTAVLFALPLAKEHSVVTESMAWIVERVCIGSSCPDSLNLVGVSSMAVAVKSRKLRGYVFGSGLRGNETLAQAAGRMAVSE
jgi:hypothetical protein